MVQVKHITGDAYSSPSFQQKMNDLLRQLYEDDMVVASIQYSSCANENGKGYSALIVYERRSKTVNTGPG